MTDWNDLNGATRSALLMVLAMLVALVGYAIFLALD
jgi:hypothetical protein